MFEHMLKRHDVLFVYVGGESPLKVSSVYVTRAWIKIAVSVAASYRNYCDAKSVYRLNDGTAAEQFLLTSSNRANVVYNAFYWLPWRQLSIGLSKKLLCPRWKTHFAVAGEVQRRGLWAHCLHLLLLGPRGSLSRGNSFEYAPFFWITGKKAEITWLFHCTVAYWYSAVDFPSFPAK